MKRFSILCLLLMQCTLMIAQSKFDNREAFNPQFYPYPGNDYRSASGEPGPKYWQNRADYSINCTLDTAKHSVSAEVVISYTNNSPDNLKFLWMQVDQNIYRQDSRATATTTAATTRRTASTRPLRCPSHTRRPTRAACDHDRADNAASGRAPLRGIAATNRRR